MQTASVTPPNSKLISHKKEDSGVCRTITDEKAPDIFLFVQSVPPFETKPGCCRSQRGASDFVLCDRRARGGASCQSDMLLQVYDFSRVTTFFSIFQGISQLQEIGFSPVTGNTSEKKLSGRVLAHAIKPAPNVGEGNVSRKGRKGREGRQADRWRESGETRELMAEIQLFLEGVIW